MPLPVVPLSLITLGAGAVIGATSYVRTKKAQKRGDTSAFADREDEPVGVEMESPYKEDSDYQDPPKAPKEPTAGAGKPKTKVKSRAPKVPEPA